MFYSIIRPLLFQLPPETVHYLVCGVLSQLESWKLLPSNKPNEHSIPLMGLHFRNRVGLAAGFDKNGDCIDGLAALGFGFIEIGTVTPRPQSGNPRPRLFRIPKAQALINRMGFNNQGVDYLIERVKKMRYKGVLGINIGKNAATPLEQAVDDYRYCLERVYPYASYITLNISSPNTPGLRSLQNEEELTALLVALKTRQGELAQQYAKYVPLLVKIAPDLSGEAISEIAEIFIEQQIDGVIASNTTISREMINDLPHAEETGGLSGVPLFPLTLSLVKQLHQSLQGKIPIIACGGIHSEKTAQEMLAAGADLIQVYTGFIYQGPKLIKQLAKI